MLGVAPWIFWMTTVGLSVMVAATLWRAYFLGTAGQGPAAAYDLRVYRDQLAEVERDLARGVIAPEDADRMRTEISRRVLEADRAVMSAGSGGEQASGNKTLLAALATVLLVGSFALYWDMGAPGYPDMPLKSRLAMAEELRTTRPDQKTAEADTPAAPRPEVDPRYTELIDKLRTAVAERPNDLQGQELLARNEAGIGNFAAAYAAQERVIALKAPRAEAEDFATLAELMILAAGGYISPQAEAQLSEALKIDPTNGTALYYSGVMLAQTGRPDLTFEIWRRLLERSAPNDPWLEPLRAQIERVAMEAGVEYQIPAFVPTSPDQGSGANTGAATAAPGPTAEDMAAAADMTPEERQAMIRGMVEQLNDRLAAEGGTAAEWARLIGALGTLGEADRARAIWTEAQGRFAERPDDLAMVRAAAVQAGVAE